MSRPGIRLLRFGAFEMDLEARELRRRGSLVPLPPQPFAVLAELATRSGHVVPREELQALLWGDGVHVDRARGLNHCLNRIRRVLGDDAQSPRFVETVPRLGYRFLASVQAAEHERDRIRPAPLAAPTPLTPTLPPAPAPLLRRGDVFPWLTALAAIVIVLQHGGGGAHARAGVFGAPSPNRPAQSAFTEGRRLLDEGPAGWRRSVEHFREATRQDPGFALAHYSLADAYMRLGEHGVLPAPEAFPAARRAALLARALADGAPVQLILATLSLNYDWDWAAAEAAYQRALSLDPDLIGARTGYARLLSASGRHDEALRLIGETETRHPGCPVILRDAALVHYHARRFDEAARRFRDWSALEPERPDPHHWLALLLHLRGQDELALREVRAVMAVAKAPPDYAARFEALAPAPALRLYIRGSIVFLEGLASAEWVTGDDFARLRALLGERELALRDLERAADERSPRLLPYLNDPAFDPLRTDPRFVALQRRVRAPTPVALSRLRVPRAKELLGTSATRGTALLFGSVLGG